MEFNYSRTRNSTAFYFIFISKGDRQKKIEILESKFDCLSPFTTFQDKLY